MATVETFKEGLCVVCRGSKLYDNDTCAVGPQGLKTLIDASKKRSDLELTEYLESSPPVVVVHNTCRQVYTSKRRIEQWAAKVATATHPEEEQEPVKPKCLRSSTPVFNFSTCCFFCTEVCVIDGKHINDQVRNVGTIEKHKTILNMCDARNDDWAVDVRGRLMNCSDLRAPDAVYHTACQIKFSRPTVSTSRGRPIDYVKQATFNKLCEWLEVNDCDLLTLRDLADKATTLVDDNEAVYSEQWLRSKLKQKYGDHIQFCYVRGRRDVICWKEMAAYIVNEKWHQDQKVTEPEHIVITAAKLLRTVIREADYSMDNYPTCSDISEPERAKNWLPSLLYSFLDTLICPEGKKVALGHSIVQAVRPRSVIAPLPFAVGITVDHVCASKYLLNILSHCGMSVSYDEVGRYKQSVTSCDNVDLPESYPAAFTQFAADNVDHDVCTLDGTGTLHAMGLISMTNSCSGSTVQSGNFSDQPIKRVKRMKAADIAQMKRIPLLQCVMPTNASRRLRFRSDQNFRMAAYSTFRSATDMDLLWHTGWFFHNNEDPRPSWAGFNDSALTGTAFPASDIRMLPIIDLNPNDLSCIYSTLVFIINQAAKLKVVTPCVTFDQPLWQKAFTIIKEKELDIVCRLGTFHTEMSFLGSIGTLMAGSGISEVLECVYGPNTVKHILSGKAVSRAVRAHFLIESALTVILLKSVMSLENIAALKPELQVLYNTIAHKGYDVNGNVVFPDFLKQIECALTDLKASLSNSSRTAKLWVLYTQYVSVLKQSRRAERMADWQLHLHSIGKMVNLFAATGHNNYAKCSRLYLEIMTDLPVTHPALYEQFTANNHVARRSTKQWNGLSTDLTIEQCMMRALKGGGGLTHGRGVTESVRTTWVSTVHKCAGVQTALSKFTNLEHSYDDMLHPEMGKTRAKRDNADLSKIIEYLEQHNPFNTADSRLHSLTSGIAASESDNITCDTAEEVGASIVMKMDGVNLDELVLRKKDQIRSLSHVITTSSGVKKAVNIDPIVLFNRLLIIMHRSLAANDDIQDTHKSAMETLVTNPAKSSTGSIEPSVCDTKDIKSYFAYELSALPASLFKDGHMRKTDKSQLAKQLTLAVKSTSLTAVNSSQSCTVIIDGGFLLHAVHWPNSGSYADVAHCYVSYVCRHFGPKAVIVFDGYCSGPNTKDHEHQRRAGKSAPDIVLEPNSTRYNDQAAFMSNDNNKKQLVILLTAVLQSAGHSVLEAADDADTLVVKEALRQASSKDHEQVHVIANDTDILVLLVYHYKAYMCDIIMYTDPDRNINSIQMIHMSVDPTVVAHLLVIHAISGCDTTSALFGHGKVSVLKKLSGACIQHQVDVLESVDATHSSVEIAGCGLLALLYGGSVTDKLNRLRYTSYNHITATSTQPLCPERLPPTEHAARYHAYRAHLQVVQWKELTTSPSLISPVDWGWKLHDARLIPIGTDLDIAPPELLKVICCRCKVGTRNQCGTQSCQCRKLGLACIAACKHCNGFGCDNSCSDASAADFDVDEDLVCDDESCLSDRVCQPSEPVYDDFLDYFMPWETEEVVM